MSTSIEYGHPPVSARQVRNGEAALWAASIRQRAELTGKRDEWAKLPKAYGSRASAYSLARTIARAKTAAWAPAGSWDSTVRNVDGVYFVWVRWNDNMLGGSND